MNGSMFIRLLIKKCTFSFLKKVKQFFFLILTFVIKSESPQFKVEADKGFYFSSFDNAFVCQKKNHFQITIHVQIDEQPVYCKNKAESSQYLKIERIEMHLYGIKEESQFQKIFIKQSDSDRKPIDYIPVVCNLKPMHTNKLTQMRLHFAHTTANNNKKKNKPNPDQRYFLLIVELRIITENERHYTMFSAASEKVIVRVRFLYILI
jgi:hypothetical protein